MRACSRANKCKKPCMRCIREEALQVGVSTTCPWMSHWEHQLYRHSYGPSLGAARIPHQQ